MALHWFDAGAKLSWNGETFVVASVSFPSEIWIRSEKARVAVRHALPDLLEAYRKKNLVFLSGKDASAREMELIQDLDDVEKAEVEKRLHYVTTAVSDSNSVSKDILEMVGKVVSAQIGDKNPPSWWTIRNWVVAFQKSSGDPRSLIRRLKDRGNKKLRVDAESRLLMKKAIAEKYLTLERASARDAYDYWEILVNKANRERVGLPPLRIIAYVNFTKYLKKLPPEEVIPAREGPEAARRKLKSFGMGRRPQRPLEEVQVDATPLPILVLDSKTWLPMGRPTLYTSGDQFSGGPTGIYLGFEPPSYTSLACCLAHSILPKTYVAERYPKIKNTWDCYGVPERLIVDNGKEYYSEDFKHACYDVGIREVIWTPRRSPWAKGSIESFFSTMNRRLLKSMPGKTFSDIFERGEYDPAKNAVVTLDALMEITHTWICDEYLQKPHGYLFTREILQQYGVTTIGLAYLRKRYRYKFLEEPPFGCSKMIFCDRQGIEEYLQRRQKESGIAGSLENDEASVAAVEERLMP